MNHPTNLIPAQRSPFDALMRHDGQGEHWLGRDLMGPLDYDKWERFAQAIERARVSIAASGHDPDVHASRLREASGRTERANYRLTRYGAYLAAMNGDVRKVAIAGAQAYFAAKAREAEVAEQRRQVELEPITWTWDETAAVIRQRYGMDLSVVQLTRLLRSAGVLKVNGTPRKGFGDLFWFTGSHWEIHPHAVAVLARKVDDQRRTLREFQFIQTRLEVEGVGQHNPSTGKALS